MSQKRNTTFNKLGFVNAIDSAFTGTEPTWDGSDSWPLEKFRLQFSRMLNFYAYYLGSDDLAPELVKYAKKKLEWSDEKVARLEKVLNSKEVYFSSTVGKICRAINLGMSTRQDGPEKFMEVVDDEFKKLSQVRLRGDGREVVQDSQAPATEVSESVQDKIRAKVNRTILSEFDDVLDLWCTNGYRVGLVPGKNFPTTRLLTQYEVSAPGAKIFLDRVTAIRDELTGALAGEDEQLKEAYRQLNKAEIKNRMAYLTAIIQEVTIFISGKKAARVPRVKKSPTAEKQTSKLKFQGSDNGLKISSISPLRIPSAQVLYAFNTRYKKLMVFLAESRDGLAVKGSKVKGYDSKKSYVLTLRKPGEILPTVLGKTQNQIDKMLEKVKGKRGSLNGSINENTLLLRVL